MRPAAPNADALDLHSEPPRDDDVWFELDDADDGWTEVHELPEDVERTIRTTGERLDDIDAWALIGVEQDADWEEIARAFRQRLATFHPNRWSGYRLRDLRPTMDRVVERLSHAFAALAEERGADATGTSASAMEPERPTSPATIDTNALDFEGDRPTYPSMRVVAAPPVHPSAPPRARPPRPPPRRR